MVFSFRAGLLTTSAVFLLSACSVQTTAITDEQLREAATVELSAMFPAVQAVSGSVSLDETVQRAVINNLDNRLSRLERSYASRQVEVDSLDMLPVLAANAGYSRRSNDGYTTSQPLGSPVTNSFSRGSDATIRTADLSVSWNVLDFAMGYYNAQQAGNRAFIAEERARRAGMDVIRQAKNSYWRAYAAQDLSGRVGSNIEDAERVLDVIREGESSGAIPAMQALEQSRVVLENIRQLETANQELSRARTNLAQMINVAPGQSFVLAGSRMEVPSIGQSLTELEQLAFLQNPTIREQAYRERIALSDVKKTTAELFPNLSASAQMNYSSDDFLREGDWNTFGLNVGMNLLRLATAPQRRGLAQEGVSVEQARSLAVRMAVLAQTHIAYRDYQFARQQFDRVRELAQVEASIAEQSRNREQASAGSQVRRVTDETSAILSQLRVYRAYAELVSAHDALKATVGEDDELIALIAEQRRLYETALADAEEAEGRIASLEAQVADLQREAARLERGAESAQSDLARATAARLEAEQDLASEKQVSEALSAELSAARSQLGAVSNQNADVSSREAALAQNLSGLEAQVAAQREQVAAVDAAIRQQERANAGLAREQSAVARSVARADARAERVRGRMVDASDERRAQLEVELAEISAELEGLSASAQELDRQLSTGAAQLSNLERQRADLDASSAELSARAAAADAELGRMSGSARDVARLLSSLERDVAEAERNVARQADRVRTATDALAAAQSAEAAAQAAHEAALSAHAASAAALTDAQSGLAQAGDDLVDAEARATYYGAS